ncbi:hypothetical protein [Amycolatopsis sp. CA-230715]|uniref:hypothetical protein n=1 Tax=Amycolatopsis sp. CA-230715 TaxID=2745196 RepID=UPI001C01C6F2|nr:hypothetical protein [Amycolatopsis sp. CA-230715]QWF85634.1 hypothetical protein HUW46_09089 [Amycolatopsis sp. CA-230715]
MTDIIRITPDMLDDAAGRLRGAGEAADDLRGSVPDVPDAGASTTAAGEVVAHLVDAAAQLACGLGALGDAVTAAATAYRDTDTAASDQLMKLWTN